MRAALRVNFQWMQVRSRLAWAFQELMLVAREIQFRNAAGAQALPGEEAELDFGLVEPTPMFGCVMDLQAAPDVAAFFAAEVIGEGLATVNVEIVHHPDGSCEQRDSRRPSAGPLGRTEPPSGWALHS